MAITRPRMDVGERIASVDVLRGFAILLMAIGNFGLGVRWVPAALKHASDVGYTIADLVAPLFILSIAFTARVSLRRRMEEDGVVAAIRHVVARSAILIVVGAVFTAGEAILQPKSDLHITWGVLQAIGTASLVALPFLLMPAASRLVVGFVLLTAYQWLLDHQILGDVVRTEHNGPWGSLSWAGLLVLGTVVADTFYAIESSQRRLLSLSLSGLVAIALALLITFWVPISKHRASATYMLLSLGLSVLLLAVFHGALRNASDRLLLLQQMGRNPLVLYFANLLLLAAFTLPQADGWYAGAPVWLSVLQALIIVLMNVTVAKQLDRRALHIRL